MKNDNFLSNYYVFELKEVQRRQPCHSPENAAILDYTSKFDVMLNFIIVYLE